jgi:hypothetical protein
MNKKFLFLLSAIAGLTSTNSYSEEYYLIGAVDYTSVEIDSESFNPLMSQLKFGVKGTDNKLFRGVGLELVVGQAFKDDGVDGFNINIDHQLGLYSTFTYTLDKMDFSVNLGYTVTELATESSILNSEFNQTAEGLSYGFRFHRSIEMIPNFGWTLDCTRYYSEDDVSIDACGVGVSYEF